MRAAPLLFLLIANTLGWCSTGQVSTNEAIRNFIPHRSDTSIYSVFVENAESITSRNVNCSVRYTAAVYENIQGETAQAIEFCSESSLHVGRKYLVAVIPVDLRLFPEESAKNLEQVLPDNTLVRHWAFEIYDVHLEDGSIREVVKIPEPIFHAPEFLLHAQVQNCQNDGFYKAMYNVIYWRELLSAMELSLRQN